MTLSLDQNIIKTFDLVKNDVITRSKHLLHFWSSVNYRKIWSSEELNFQSTDNSFDLV